MNEIIIRTATLNDLETLLRFEQGIIATERPFDPTLKKDPISYYDLAALITSAEAAVIVAEVNSEIVGSGYALIKASKPYEDHGRYAYLGFMFVEDHFRGRGINKKIIGGLTAWAVEQGLKEIRLEVYSGNTNAVKAYEKVGFKAHMLEMRMSVG